VIDWSDAQAATELVSGLVNDAFAVVEALRDTDLDDGPAAALALLAATAGQDVEPAGGSDGTDGRRKLARKVAEDRIISQVDPQSRHACKNGHTRTDGSVSDILCAGLFPVRFRTFIRNPFFALSDYMLSGLSGRFPEPDIRCSTRADAACPGFLPVLPCGPPGGLSRPRPEYSRW
jgi:hypothetical protein